VKLPVPARLRRVVERFDIEVELAIAPVRGRYAVVDRAAYALSWAGDWSRIWHAAGLARLALGCDPVGLAVRSALALGAESLVVNQGLKRLTARPRPDALTTGHHPHRLRHPTTSSFPSGHASAAAFAATVLGARSHSPMVKAGWWTLATGIGVSRVYVRAHHASDVVAGAAIGVAMGATAREWLARSAGSGR
jgi:membrane-associated phospholipid phosphatase